MRTSIHPYIMLPKIDLVLINAERQSVNWQYGQVYTAAYSVDDMRQNIQRLVQESKAEWVLFWDADLGEINETLTAELAQTNLDVWHAGLRLGTSGLMNALNYINPAWIYNKDATPDVSSSSFRLSLKASLIRLSVLKEVLPVIYPQYTTVDAMGLCMGYAIIRKGGMMRYHHTLVKQQAEKISLSERDEWIFIKQFFPAKWHWWVVLNKKGLLNNIRNKNSINNVAYIHLKPDLHSSAIKHAAIPKTVSVLAPTLDRYSYLKNELDQLSVQTIMPLEVLVTDQTDDARRQTIDANEYTAINLRWFPQSEKGQCIAWNKLIEEAKGEYLLFLGDDADNITPDFIEKLLGTAQYYNADMVASNVVELGLPPKPVNPFYYMSDTFPITLIRREVVVKAGGMDMFFNRNIRADYDLALRCHQLGAFMVFDSSALIDHHRAPVGGLRTYKARAITNRTSKNSITKFAEPTSSELFLLKKYFGATEFINYVRIKYFDQLMINGGWVKRLVRLLVFMGKLPAIQKRYKANLAAAINELQSRH